MTARRVDLVNLGVLVLYIIGAIAAWPSLPERIPTHFGINGTPDAWSETTWLGWFGIPLLAVGLALLLYGSSRLARRSAHMWNLPEKKLFLSLPKRRREPVVARLERVVAVCGLMTTVTFIGIHIGVYQTAMRKVTGLPWYSTAIAGAAVFVILAFSAMESTALAREIRHLSSETD